MNVKIPIQKVIAIWSYLKNKTLEHLECAFL